MKSLDYDTQSELLQLLPSQSCLFILIVFIQVLDPYFEANQNPRTCWHTTPLRVQRMCNSAIYKFITLM